MRCPDKKGRNIAFMKGLKMIQSLKEFSKVKIFGIDSEVLNRVCATVEKTELGKHTYRECFYRMFEEIQKRYMEEGKSPRTLADIESCNRLYVLADDLPYETIADDYIEDITPAMVKKFKKNIEKFNYLIETNAKKPKEGLSHSRLNSVFSWIDKVFNYAYDNGLIEHKSFLDDINLTKYGGVKNNKHVKRNFLSLTEFQIFNETFDRLASSYFHHGIEKIEKRLYGTEFDFEAVCKFRSLLYKSFYNMAFYTGLRKNELRGLKWKDLIQNTNGFHSIKVEKQFNDKCNRLIGKVSHVRDPKSYNAFRVVCLHKDCYEVLDRLRKFLLAYRKYNDEEFIFMDFFVKNPKPIPETNLDRCFKRVIKESKIIENSVGFNGSNRNVTIHGFRHAACTFYMECGMEKEMVAKILGHSDTHLIDTCYREFVQVSDLESEKLETCMQFFK